MDFEELHGKSGSGMNVGVDLTTLMTSQIATSTAGESGGGGSGSGDMTVPRIASFQVYWDVQGKQFKVFSPKVVDPNGNEIAVTETALSRGTYVCEVKKNKTTNVYTAAIKLIDSIVPSAETVTVVKLFTIKDGKVEQYHVGAIILGDKKGGSSSNPAAFDLEVSESSTGTKIGKIVRCNFVFDGENKSLPDFSVSGSGSVYLVAKQPSPSGGVGDLPWTFEISESEGEAAEGGRVVNYKLYDLNGFAVTCDYRTTFMELKSPHHVSKFTVSKYEKPQSSVVIEACQDTEAKITVSGSDGHSLTLKASEGEKSLVMSDGDEGLVRARLNGNVALLRAQVTLSRYATIFENGANAGATFMHDSKSIDFRTNELNKGNSMGVHVLTVKDVNGNVIDELNVLSTKDITIVKAQGTVLKDISLQYTNYELQMTKTKVDLATGQETTEGPSRVFPTELHSAQS